MILSPIISGCLLFDATAINTSEDLIAHYIGLSTLESLDPNQIDDYVLSPIISGCLRKIIAICQWNGQSYRPLYRAVYKLYRMDFENLENLSPIISGCLQSINFVKEHKYHLIAHYIGLSTICPLERTEVMIDILSPIISGCLQSNDKI